LCFLTSTLFLLLLCLFLLSLLFVFSFFSLPVSFVFIVLSFLSFLSLLDLSFSWCAAVYTRILFSCLTISFFSFFNSFLSLSLLFRFISSFYLLQLANVENELFMSSTSRKKDTRDQESFLIILCFEERNEKKKKWKKEIFFFSDVDAEVHPSIANHHSGSSSTSSLSAR